MIKQATIFKFNFQVIYFIKFKTLQFEHNDYTYHMAPLLTKAAGPETKQTDPETSWIIQHPDI
jgi:hypothetical protein